MLTINQSLIRLVDDTLLNIGMPIIKHPIFYHCPIGIRFELSEPWGDVNSAYFKNAYNKAFQIYSDLSAGLDILRIDITLDAEKSSKEQRIKRCENLRIICSTTGLPLPAEEREIFALRDASEETLPLNKVECYWDVKKNSLDIKALLMQIILTDFPSQSGGNPQFESSVFLFDTCQNVMFHLYDDRGLDLVAKERSTLYPFYKKYKHWILQYNKEQIDNIFK